MKSLLLSVFSALVLITPARALILYGGDNSANTTDPGGGVPWQSVGQVAGGSAVYIGGGYMLTANHVSLGGSVTFDGVTYYNIKASSAQGLGGGVDLMVFQLEELPSVAAAKLLLTPSENFDSSMTMIGWGVGRDGTPVGENAVGWGDASTVAKRWGQNVLRGAEVVSDSGYEYESLVSMLGSSTGDPAGLGANEAAATIYDSGSGVFQQIGGEWYLVGITTAVTHSGVSIFGDDSLADGEGGNYSVRLSTYSGEIIALVPEPMSIGLLLCAGIVLLIVRRSGTKAEETPLLAPVYVRNRKN